jgi:hypothetical protein
MCTEQLPQGGYPIAVKYISSEAVQPRKLLPTSRRKRERIPSIFNDESTGTFICLRSHIYMSHVNKVQLIRVKMIRIAAIRPASLREA